MTKKKIIEDIKRAITSAMDVAIAQTKKELRDQGHVLTGNLLNSIEQKVRQQGNSIISDMLLADYFEAVNDGVNSGNIPYGGRGGGGASKYIQGLISFFQRRGRNGDEAKRAAFATANRHKIEGMPSRGSYRFSSNGRRKNFLGQAIEDSTDEITAEMLKIVEYFQATINSELRTLSQFKVSA